MSSTSERVKQILADHLGVDAANVTPEARIIDDLGADSLDIVELVMAAEDWFAVEVTDDDAQGITTVADAVALIERMIGKRGTSATNTSAPGSQYFDVEGTPVWVGPRYETMAFDGPEPRPFPTDSALRNGAPISKDEFDRMIAEKEI